MNHWIRWLAASLVTLLATVVAADEAQDMAERIERQMQAPDRHAFDLPRDEHRKPFETFQFLGL